MQYQKQLDRDEEESEDRPKSDDIWHEGIPKKKNINFDTSFSLIYLFVEIFEIHEKESKNNSDCHKIGKSNNNSVIHTRNYSFDLYTISTFVPAVATKPTNPIKFSPKTKNLVMYAQTALFVLFLYFTENNQCQ